MWIWATNRLFFVVAPIPTVDAPPCDNGGLPAKTTYWTPCARCAGSPVLVPRRGSAKLQVTEPEGGFDTA